MRNQKPAKMSRMTVIDIAIIMIFTEFMILFAITILFMMLITMIIIIMMIIIIIIIIITIMKQFMCHIHLAIDP